MSIASELYTVLAAEAEGMTDLHTLLTGGVWSRPLVKPPAKGATTEAFDDTGRTKLTVVIPDADELDDPSGPEDLGSQLVGIAAFPEVWIYGQTTATDRTIMAQIRSAVFAKCHGLTLDGPDGSAAGLKAVAVLAIMDDPVLPATLVTRIRFQADGLWLPD